MEEDPKITLEDAVSHAVSSKNMQITRKGFSPRQLMFGQHGRKLKNCSERLMQMRELKNLLLKMHKAIQTTDILKENWSYTKRMQRAAGLVLDKLQL